MLNEEGAELLKKVIIKKYGKVELEKIIADENEFHFDFKINTAIGENDLVELEKELQKESNLFIKLIRISGVYIDGNIDNEMINRISGKVFSSKEELKEYEKFLQDAKERNHRKIGKDLDLFCFSVNNYLYSITNPIPVILLVPICNVIKKIFIK